MEARGTPPQYNPNNMLGEHCDYDQDPPGEGRPQKPHGGGPASAMRIAQFLPHSAFQPVTSFVPSGVFPVCQFEECPLTYTKSEKAKSVN